LDEAANGMDIPARKMFRKLLMKHVREDQIVVLSTHIVQDIENLLTDVIVLRKDAPVYAASLEEIASRYSFGIQSNEEGVLYAEACTEGYHVITHKQENMDTEVSLELLFNALIKGGGRI
jgi:ABC-2 type transport system ATP-binding protein